MPPLEVSVGQSDHRFRAPRVDVSLARRAQPAFWTRDPARLVCTSCESPVAASLLERSWGDSSFVPCLRALSLLPLGQIANPLLNPVILRSSLYDFRSSRGDDLDKNPASSIRKS